MGKNVKGFTLVEIILSLIVAALLGGLMVSFMGTQVGKSVVPVTRVRQEYSLNQVMENINADYRRLLLESPSPLNELRNEINAGTYGVATVLYNDFITFNGAGVEQSGGNRILKVKLSLGDQMLVTLFTR